MLCPQLVSLCNIWLEFTVRKPITVTGPPPLSNQVLYLDHQLSLHSSLFMSFVLTCCLSSLPSHAFQSPNSLMSGNLDSSVDSYIPSLCIPFVLACFWSLLSSCCSVTWYPTPQSPTHSFIQFALAPHRRRTTMDTHTASQLEITKL